MNMSYNLNPQAAIAADVIFAKIEQSGKYLGIITRAEAVTSQKGTKGIDLSFKASTGETADYLTLWTHNAEGKQLMGFNALMAIMTCMRIKNITPETGEIEKFDPNQAKRVKMSVPLFKDLMGKPIGLLLQMEEYPKKAGGTGWKPVIFAVFDDHEFTASEILNKATKPETLAKMVASLKDRPLKAATVAHPEHESGNSSAAGMHGFNEFEDDIPF